MTVDPPPDSLPSALGPAADTFARSADLLLVDDSPLSLRMLSQLLAQNRFRVRTVPGGAQALETVRLLPPDLVLLDVTMPGMDGFEVCRQIKAHPLTQDIPVIFLTGNTDMEDILRGFEVGAADYVTKPFREAELLARVRTHLELKRRRDAELQLIRELREALDQVKVLSNLLPICSHCKKIRDDAGYWADVDTYFSRYAQARFSHGICPACVKELYPGLADRVLGKEHP